MISSEQAAAEEIKEIFDLHLFGKPNVLIAEDGRLCISWNDETARYASGSHLQMLDLAKQCDGSLDRYWEKLLASNLDSPKPN